MVMDDWVIICIKLVIHMGWVDYPTLFLAILERLTKFSNTLLNTFILLPMYREIIKILKTVPDLLHTPDSLTDIY